MFIASYTNTMRNARPKFVEPEVVRTMAQIRAEKRAEALHVEHERHLAWAREIELLRQQADAMAKALRAVSAYRVIDIRDCGKTPVRPLIERVGTFHGLSYDEIIGPRRDKKAVAARFDAIKAVHDARADLSLPQLGRIFNRDHTSILHALRKRAAKADISL